jgi:hypothetical protein
MRLVTFGCSLTQGFALDGPKSRKPSKKSWPSVLGSFFDCPVVNNGYPGASNKEIHWNILNFDFKPNDVVLVLWSYKDRWCVIRGEEIKRVNVWNENEQSEYFFSKFSNDFDMSLDLHQRIQHASYYIPVTNFHLYSSRNHRRYFKWFDTEMLDISIDEIRKLYPKALDNKHPGEQAHIAYAKELYTYLHVVLQGSTVH